METISGIKARWPITHTFFNEESREQITIDMETAVNARQALECCGLMSLTYIQSKDANGEFVYDFN
jgi:hypothetical protein